MKIHSELEKAVQNDNLVIFIGSGFSKDLNFPDWKELTKKIIEKIGVNDEKLLNLIPLLQDEVFSPIEVLEKVKDKKRNISEALVESFTLSSDQITKIKKNEKYKLIWEVSNKIITTNYDKALEKSNDEIDNAVIHFNNDYGLSELSGSDKFCFKIHGCISNPSTCILLKEEYEKLYSDTLAHYEFGKIISDKIILFLGFSLSDPYVTFLMENIKKKYNGYEKTHFVITTNNDDFSNYGVENIPLDSWNDLNPFLKTLLEKKKVVKEIGSKENVQIKEIEEIEEKTKGVKVAVFKANPIDRELEYNDEVHAIKKIKCQVDYFSLTVDNLNNCCDYDYYFILTEEVKGKILIESEVLTSKLISLSDFEDNLYNSRLKGIIFMLKTLNDIDIDADIELANSYLFLNKIKKERLNSIFFKLFRKTDYKTLLNNEFKMFNQNQFTLLEINEKNNHNGIKSSHISDSIDRKNLKNFIGRKTDLIEVTKKLLEAKENDKILVIKGAGGIGKTTLIKKVALELSQRNIFEKGIYFIDCEFLSSYLEFEREVAKTFNLEQEIEFLKYLKTNIKDKDRVLIVDNFETLNYLSEADQIKKLLSKVADYATIVVTSREVLNLDFEDFYEIRSFTTEEAEKFFIQESNNNVLIVDEKDRIILREDILENILGNNPLAIKLIAKTIYKGVSIKALKSELENNFFNINENFNFAIEFKKSDRNIEKRQTLARSIYFSYKNLTEPERFIFEILSLFPNGISTENLRRLLNNRTYKKDASFKISLNEINILEKKSLIENNHGHIQLQSIIGKFAEQELNKRDNLPLYFKEVYYYNDFILTLIRDEVLNLNQSEKILEINRKNFLKVFQFIEKIDIDEIEKIDYIQSILHHLSFLDNYYELIDSLKLVKKIFKTSEVYKNFYIVLNLYYRYFNGEFESSYEKVKEQFPLNEIINYDFNDLVVCATAKKIIGIYQIAGLKVNEIKLLPLNKNIRSLEYVSTLFRIGEYDSNNIIKKKKEDFFSFDMKYNLGIINEKIIENYLNSLHEKESLEILQVTYIKAKMNLTSKEEIQKLIVVNPYARGLKMLMHAFIEEDYEEQINLYENALIHLSHIKYYYIEALYYYSLFLKEINSHEKYKKILNKGIELSKKYSYRFLSHNFYCLKIGRKIEYKISDYPFENKEIEKFLEFSKCLR